MTSTEKNTASWPIMNEMTTTGFTKLQEASLRILSSSTPSSSLSSMTKLKAKKLAKGAVLLANALLDEL